MSEVGGGTRVREGEHRGVERSLLTVPPDCKCVCANDGERECEREREGGRDGELRSSGGGAVFVFFFLIFFFHPLAVISAFISRLVISLRDEPRLSASCTVQRAGLSAAFGMRVVNFESPRPAARRL